MDTGIFAAGTLAPAEGVERSGLRASALAAAAILDLIAAVGLPLPHTLPSKILLTGDGLASLSSPADLLASAAGEPFPSWRLKLNPISIRTFAADGNQDVTVLAPRNLAPTCAGATSLLSSLLYEVMGGRRRVDGRFGPLAALSEDGNVWLRALGDGHYPDCTTFWTDFTRVVDPAGPPAPRRRASPPSRPQAWETTGAFPRDTPAADVLRLIPDDASAVPIHLIARSTFRFGRAYYEADFTTRVWPENDENYERTGRISRVHVRGEIIDGQVTLRDGNGNAASGNGSWFNGHPLAADAPMILSRRGVLNLANEYRVEVVPLFHDHLSDCHFNDFAGETVFVEQETGKIADGLHGSVTFIPLDGHKSLCDAVWLFSGIGFGLDSDGFVVWDYYGEGESPGALLHYQNRFWIKNTALPDGAVMIGAIPIQHGQIAPLASGQELRLGSRRLLLQ